MNDKLTGLISSLLIDGFHAVQLSLCTGSNNVGNISMYYDYDFSIRTTAKFTIHDFTITTGAHNVVAVTVVLLESKKVTPLTYSFYQWKLKSLVKCGGNRKIITTVHVATGSFYCTTQTKPLNDMNLMLYFLQSEITCIASQLMNIFSEHDKISLNSCSVECDSYQDIHRYHLCISLNGTGISKVYYVWKDNKIIKFMKFKSFVTEKSVFFNTNIKKYRKSHTTVSLSGKKLNLFPHIIIGGYKQCSISLSSGYQIYFFKRNSIKVSSL